MSARSTGRRSAAQPARRRPDVTLVLAVLLPLLAVALLAVTRTQAARVPLAAPEATDLSTASVACPAGEGRGRTLATTTAPVGEGAPAGQVTVRAGGPPEPVELTAGRATEVGAGRATILRGEGGLAPGLAAGRVAERPLAAVACRPPSGSSWFTGVGAGARHRSVLELVNPGEGPAVADVEVLGVAGPVDAPQLRGILVPGGSARTVDLARVLPRTDELALHVTAARGRVAASVLDTVDRLGTSEPRSDWLPAHAEAATELTLLGIPDGSGSRMLVVANPGPSEVRADLLLVTPETAFVPRDLAEVRVPPQGVARVSLDAVLGARNARDAVGVRLEASGPVTAGLRATVRGDLVHAAAVAPVTGRTVALLPDAPTARLVLADATAVGVVRLVARDGSGEALQERSVEVAPGRGAVVELPRRTVLLELEPVRTAVHGVVTLAADGGAATVGLADLQRTGQVPDVRPGLP